MTTNIQSPERTPANVRSQFSQLTARDSPSYERNTEILDRRSLSHQFFHLQIRLEISSCIPDQPNCTPLVETDIPVNFLSTLSMICTALSFRTSGLSASSTANQHHTFPSANYAPFRISVSSGRPLLCGTYAGSSFLGSGAPPGLLVGIRRHAIRGSYAKASRTAMSDSLFARSTSIETSQLRENVPVRPQTCVLSAHPSSV
jgi:hypothetical protein